MNCDMCHRPLGEAGCPYCDAPVTKAGVELVLRHSATGASIRVPPVPQTLIGRNAHGAEVLEDFDVVSREHCMIEHDGGSFTVRDWGSRSGTFVGHRLDPATRETPRPLADGTTLRLGADCLFIVELVQPSVSVAAPAPARPAESRWRCPECDDSGPNPAPLKCRNNHYLAE